MIRVENLSFSYGNDLILDNISRDFRRGEVSAVIGKNGCGKTTLLRILAGLSRANTGKITLDGADLTALSIKEHGKLVAFLPQNREVPPITVRALVSHGRFPHLGFPRKLSKKDREIIAYAMETAGVSEFSERSLTSLSGGQRQKVYLAMVLCQSTDVVLLDEPATYLDIAQQLEVVKMARRLADMGKIVVMVHHDIPQAVKYSDKIVLLDSGKVAFEGTGAELVSSGKIEEIFGVKTRVFDGNLIVE